jgi:alpha-amylase
MKKLTTGLFLLAAILLPLHVMAQFHLAKPHDIVMYQVNPRVFASDHSLKAVERHLDSISALGANVVWVMPIYPIGIEKTKNSPYCIRDYKAVAPEFGTIDDMKSLAAACHRRGMGLILDWVANHTAWDNPWVKEHPDWYTHENGEIVPVRFEGQEWADVADLNYDNKDMRRAMIDAMKFWITEVGIDGFRCDVADGVPTDFWKDCIAELRQAAKPRSIVMLAEGRNKDNLNVAGFDMDYGWSFKQQAAEVYQGKAPASSLFEADKKEYEGLKDSKVKLRFTTNHDQSTQATPPVEFKSLRGSMSAYVATIMMHGGPLIYSSQEVAYPNPISFFKYVPVNWNSHPEIYREYQKLISIYKSQRALRYGTRTEYPDSKIVAFSRNCCKHSILVLANTTNSAIAFTLPVGWQKVKTVNLITDKVYKTGKKVNLQPYEYLIIKR